MTKRLANSSSSPVKAAVNGRSGKKGKGSADEGESQQAVDDTAAHADAGQTAFNDTEEAEGNSSAAKQQLPPGLLERRLARERQENATLAAQIAELQEKLQQAKAAGAQVQPFQAATAPKVMYII